MDCSMSGFPLLHCLLEFAHVHWVDDAIQPSHPLLPPSPSGSFPMSQLFTSGGQSIGASASASVLPMNIPGWYPLGLTGLIPCSPRDSQESSPTPHFESINSSVLSLPYVIFILFLYLQHISLSSHFVKLFVVVASFSKLQNDSFFCFWYLHPPPHPPPEVCEFCPEACAIIPLTVTLIGVVLIKVCPRYWVLRASLWYCGCHCLVNIKVSSLVVEVEVCRSVS